MKVVLIYRNNISLYSQIRSIYNPKKIIEMVNFIKADVNNPIRDPKAAPNAFFGLLLSFIISPIKAPINGPIIIPNGIGDSIPNIRPNEVPIIPYLVPPNFFVPNMGII